MDELKQSIIQALTAGKLRFGEIWDTLPGDVTYDDLCSVLAALIDDGKIVPAKGTYALVQEARNV